MSSRDFSGSIRSRTPLPSLLEQGYSPKALKMRSINSRKFNSKRNYPGNNSTGNYSSIVIERIKKRPFVSLTILIFILMVFTFYESVLSSSSLLILARFKLRDRAFENGWINGCKLRKKPLLFIKNKEEVSIVWETNCEEEFELQYGIEQVDEGAPSSIGWFSRKKQKKIVNQNQWEPNLKVVRIKIPDLTDSHYVYQASLIGLLGGKDYAYNLIRPSRKTKPSIASYSFHWTSDSTSSSSTTATSSTTTSNSSLPSTPSIIHLAAVADNQYNIQVFHKIILALISYGKSLPFSPTPSFLLHAGDNVQNPLNLAQWQTDFWDPLTNLLPYNFGSTTPILLARGNHDYDKSGRNFYTGGSPARSDWLAVKDLEINWDHPGTFMSFSPHPRVRILVLDSNLVEEIDLKEQEDWLEWELERKEWKEATMKLVMVHVPPFLEFWDPESWTKGNESDWGSYVRTRLTPLLSQHGTTLIMSGHQHAYSRGFLPSSLIIPYTKTDNSSSLSTFALAAAKERGWEKSPSAQFEPGTIYTIFGGAGGTFDEERVEDWGFYEKSLRGVHHFIWITMEFEVEGTKVGKRGKKRLYRVKGDCKDEMKEGVVVGETKVDSLEWKAIGLNGKVIDEFRIESEIC